MFREKLKNDLNGISPDEELLNKVTKAMQEEAAKPRQPKSAVLMRFGGMAAAVCMIAVGAVALRGGTGIKAEKSADYSVGNEAEAVVCEAEPLEECDTESLEAMPSVEFFAMTEAVDTEPAVMDIQEEETPEDTEMEQEVVLPENKAAITLPDFENKGVYITLGANPGAVGTEITYEQVMDGRADEADSFYRIAITGVLTKEQAAELSGYNADIDEGATFYNAEIQQDYISGEAMSESIILRLSGDNLYNTEYGNPCYAEGDNIAAVLQKNGENEAFRRRFSFAFAYDVYEIEGKEYLTVRNRNIPEVTEGLTDYFGGQTVSYETTTPSNPAVYYGLYEAEGVAANIRALWEAKEEIPAETTAVEEVPEAEEIAPTDYIHSITSYYKGVEAGLNGQEHYDIVCAVLDYAALNPDKKADPAFTSANIESFAEYGISVCYETENGERIRVLIDEMRSYVQVDGSFYILEGDSKEEVMSYFGEAEIVIDLSEAVFKGEKVVLTETEAYEIWNILDEYALSNPNKSLDTEYAEVDFDSVCQNGLYFYARGYKGEKAFIYIDSSLSYAVVNRNYYIFEGKERDRVLEYFSEYGTIEDMYVTPKVLSGSRVMYKGMLYNVTLDEISEVNTIVEDYIKENTHRIVSRTLTEEEISGYEAEGLSITLYYTDGSENHVYADEEDAYICGENTYLLGPNLHSQVITYAEAVRFKKALGL